MLLLWDVSLASVKGRMGEDEGRVAARSKPSFLQAGALKGLEWQSWLRNGVFDSSSGKQGLGEHL